MQNILHPSFYHGHHYYGWLLKSACTSKVESTCHAMTDILSALSKSVSLLIPLIYLISILILFQYSILGSLVILLSAAILGWLSGLLCWPDIIFWKLLCDIVLYVSPIVYSFPLHWIDHYLMLLYIRIFNQILLGIHQYFHYHVQTCQH